MRVADATNERTWGNAWDPPRAGIVTTTLALAPAVCAVLVILGSLAFKTERVWANHQTWREGAARWAGWTFLYGFAALALLVAALLLPRYLKPLAAASAAVPFALAAYLGRKNWLRLIEERDRPRDYDLHIAAGLPLVTVAAAVGLVLAVVLAVFWLWRARRGAMG